MKKILLLIFIVGFQPLFGQDNSNPIKLLVSARVDTSSKNVKAIINLYENYFKSQPDSIYDNPNWNKSEKALYKDFDFSRESLFQGGMTPNYLFQYYSPFVLSVEPIGERYQIRVLFSSPATDQQYAGSKVWCIQKLNAIKENNSWVLENLMVEISENWSSKKVGCIDYIYPPKHQFNEQEAARAEAFCNEIIRRFNPSYTGSFTFYITRSIDEMGLLENFDYYFVGMTTGKAREGMILSAKGNEYYPHEFVHKLLPANPNRGDVIEEGLAEFLGTRVNKPEYETLMNKLASDLINHPERINFKSVISQTVQFNGYQTKYPGGAAICEVIYANAGDEGITQIMRANTKDYSHIIAAACAITQLSTKELEAAWYETLKKYYHQN